MIRLTGTSNSGEAISRSAITGNTGSYTFANLPAGTYALTESQPTAVADGKDSTQVTNATTENDRIANLVISGNQSFTENHFGEVQLRAAYTSIAWFFASSTTTSSVLRETMANAEWRAGNTQLAQAIRDGGSAPAPTNRLPVATADTFTTTADTPLNIAAANGVLANDTDADGNPLTASLVSTTTHGTLALNANGSFTYTPAAGYTGSDSFSYRANDGQGFSNTITVSLTIASAPNTFSLAENSATGTLVGRLSPPANSGTLSFELVNASLPVDLKLRPDDHSTGSKSAPLVLIEYLDLQDPDNQSFHEMVRELEEEFEEDLLVVRRHFPVASQHANATRAARVAEAAGRQGKFDDMIDLLFEKQDDWESVSDPTAVFNGYAQQLSLNMTQFAADVADASIAARVQRDVDAAGRLNATAAPVYYLNGEAVDLEDAEDDFEEVIEDALQDFDRPFVIDRVTGDIFVADGSQLNFEATPSYTLQINGTNASGTSTPISVTIKLTDVNESAPVALADTYTTAQNTTLAVTSAQGVLKNDTDADGNTLAATLVTNVTSGTLTLNGDGSFNYVPNNGFSGTDSFTYRASDGAQNSNIASVSINVTAANTAPVATAETYTATEDTPLAVNAATGVLANDQDVNGDTLTASLVGSPAHGTLTLNTNGSFTYTPAAGYTGSDSFTYQASDGSLSSSVVTVTLNVAPVNDAPLAVNDTYTTSEDTALNILAAEGVLKNDSDVESNALTATIADAPLHGTVVVNADGSFSYTPAANYHGSDLFTYRANDATTASNLGTVAITISPVNDLPLPVTDAYTVAAGGTLNVTPAQGVTANDTDADGNTLSATVVATVTHGTLTLNANGSFTYQPEPAYAGADSFSYRVNDGQADSAEIGTVTITVNAPNQAPVAVAETYHVTQDTVLSVAAAQGVLANDTDPDGDSLLATVISPPTHGTLQLGADGTLQYTPQPGFTGNDSFAYQVSDGELDSNTVQVSLIVDPSESSDEEQNGALAALAAAVDQVMQETDWL
jgi:VCBS repeat-containing protein